MFSSNNPLRVFTAFSGYDSQCLALERLKEEIPGFDYVLVGWSEIDAMAIKAHNALFPAAESLNFGDISKINWGGQNVPDFDLFTYSFPCTDISNAGLQKGFSEGSGTRSSLLWECARAIETKRPKYLLMENVKALVSDKFMPEFKRWMLWLQSLGYNNFTQVMNAKDYGVPQNRERVFMVSVLDDTVFYFPKPYTLDRRLKDVLEANVDESYYLSDEKIQSIIEHCERKQAEGCGFKTNFQTPDGISGTIKTREGQREYGTYIQEDLFNEENDLTNEQSSKNE